MKQFSAIAVIYNPNSTGNAEVNAKQLRRDLKEVLPKVPVTLLPTERAGHAIELAYEFAKNKKRPLIVSASGDGGYNEVINGALRAQEEGASPTCAVLPSGNANDHARTMHDKTLFELITEQKLTHLDVLKITAASEDGTEIIRYAHSYTGIGLTPTVAVELNKHTLNSLKEALIIVKTFWNYRPVTVLRRNREIRVDSIICSTIPEMAKVLKISRKANPRDGLFEVAIFKHHKKVTLIFRLIKGIFKYLGAQLQTDNFVFTLLMPAPMQVDGEVMELGKNTKVTITICRRMLHTVAAV